jgi:preprotein translocase subunit SecF
VLQFFKSPRYDFLGKRRYAYAFSALLVAASFVSLAARGLNYGVDFRGGTEVRLRFAQRPDLAELRSRLAGAGLGDATLQRYGAQEENEVLVRVGGGFAEGAAQAAEDVSRRVLQALDGGASAASGGIELRSVDYVGPSVGQELRKKALLAVVGSLIGILLYLGFRFEPKYGLSAVVTVAHDAVVCVGLFSLTQRPFDLTVVAAVLTIVGYSLNDTIVIFDRVRENLRLKRGGAGLAALMNDSVNETLSRSILTSLTVLLVVLSLFLFGGDRINDFSFAMLVGVVVGSYSTIYISCPFVLVWEAVRERRRHRAAA